VLAGLIHRDIVDDVIRDCGKREKRQRLLPAHVVMYYVLALNLFFGEAYEEVLRQLVNGLKLALLLFLWVRFGGAAQGAGPLLPGQGRLRRRYARALRAPLDLRASATPSGRACGQAGGLPGWLRSAPEPPAGRWPPVKIVE